MKTNSNSHTAYTATDFLSAMAGRQELGALPFVFTAYRELSDVRLSKSQNSFLFVLEGAIRCLFDKIYHRLAAGTILVIDKEQLRSCTADAGSVVMEYTPPAKMSEYISRSAKAFRAPCSDPVYMDEELSAWCLKLLKEYILKDLNGDLFFCTRCRELTAILLGYSTDALGTIYIPLKACSLHKGGCAGCNMEPAAGTLEYEPVAAGQE